MRYLTLAFIGLAAQLAVVVGWAAGGFDFMEMLGVLGLVDLAFCAVVYLVWMPREARRMGIEKWSPFAAATALGLCFSFPLFLHAREKERSGAA